MNQSRSYADWGEVKDSPRASAQREAVLARIVSTDCMKIPSIDMVQAWHREMFDGLAPDNDYLGNFRNEDKVPKCLQGVNVHVGPVSGTPYDRVIEEVEEFMQDFNERLEVLDDLWEELSHRKLVIAVDQMIKLSAWAHGEWVRIHPYINGNGRTSRLWINFIFSRFGFPCIGIKPRPDEPYGRAARLSMQYGDHRAMESVIWELVFMDFKDKIIPLISKQT